jgi:hypothetical protein
MTRIYCILFFLALYLNAQGQTPLPKIRYYGRASAGVLTGQTSSVSFQVANGIAVNHVDLGLALGLEVHDYSAYAPIALESRYNFGKGTIQPFIGVCVGYLAALNTYHSYRGGHTAGINIGVTHFITKHFGISTALGYRYSYTNQQPPEGYTELQWYYNGQNMIRYNHRLEFRVGIAIR